MKPLLNGAWSDGLKWEFYEDGVLPDESLCMAVSCLFFYEGKVVLVRNARGWEIPGGHIDEGETIAEALCSEMWEEVGVDVDYKEYSLRWYRKLYPPAPMKHRDREGENYPFPFWYLATYICHLDVLPLGPQASDVLEIKMFSLDEVRDSDFRAREVLLHAFEKKNSL